MTLTKSLARPSVFLAIVFSLARCTNSDTVKPILPLPPTIDAISPTSGSFNTSVTLTGTNFGDDLSAIEVRFNGVLATLVSVKDDQVIAKVGARSGTGPVTVSNSQGTEEGPTFTYAYTVNVSTVAGAGSAGFAEGIGTSASFNFPAGFAFDLGGTLFIGDRFNQRIRRLEANGTVTTYTGGVTGGNDGDISVATFSGPNGVAFDSDGNMYVSEVNGNRIRKITPLGVVSTVAGSGTAGYVNATGTNAQFAFPVGLVLDGAKNIYVAEFNNHVVRKITPAGEVTTLAGDGTPGYADGTGSAAKFYNPSGIDIDPLGNLYVSEIGNNRIRKVTPTGVVTTVAGDGTFGYTNGPRLFAQFAAPRDVAVDSDGNIYVTDGSNNVIRMIPPNGNVITLAGSGTAGLANGPGSTAMFKLPYAIALDAAGNLIVGERDNAAVRKIEFN